MNSLKKYTNSSYIFEKVLNLLHVRERQIKTALKYPFPHQLGKNPKGKWGVLLARLWGNRYFSNTSGGSVIWHLSKLWMHIFFDTAIPLLGIYPMERFGLMQNNVWTRLIIVELQELDTGNNLDTSGIETGMSKAIPTFKKSNEICWCRKIPIQRNY